MPCILVVDDEAAVRDVLRDCFELEDYKVVEAATRSQTLELLSTQSIDLITLDVKLGAVDGLSLAREIRTQHAMPIVMVSGKADPIDRIVGLEIGADDYITKPFHLREVLARVRSVLRRSELTRRACEPAAEPTEADLPSNRSFTFAGWVLDADSRELKREHSHVQPLTTAEFDLLLLFVERPQRVLSRNMIMDQLKGHDWSPMDRSIDTLVGRLRKKVESPETDQQLIKTVRGVGYMLATPVKRD